MFVIDNPGKPDIFRFAKNDMRVAVYRDLKVRFYVSDYFTAAGKQNQRTLSDGNFKDRAEAISFAAKICSMYKGKVDQKGNAKIKPLMEAYRSFKGNGLSRKEISNRINAAVSNIPEHMFWSSDTILKEAGLQTPDKRYNDIVYGFISTLRNTPGIIPNIRIETLPKGNKFFTALDGQRKRPAKISRTIKI